MIRKTIEDKLTWPSQLKFCLFALKGMPAREIQGSLRMSWCSGGSYHHLSLLYDTCLNTSHTPVRLLDWMDNFEKRVSVVREAVRDKLDLVHVKNQELQKQKKLRDFYVGDRILLRVAGMPDKLAQSWEGPYKIVNKIGLVNYELDLGSHGKRKRRSVVHINNIKLWHDQDISIHRVVIAEDEVIDESKPKINLCPEICLLTHRLIFPVFWTRIVPVLQTNWGTLTLLPTLLTLRIKVLCLANPIGCVLSGNST